MCKLKFLCVYVDISGYRFLQKRKLDKHFCVIVFSIYSLTHILTIFQQLLLQSCVGKIAL